MWQSGGWGSREAELSLNIRVGALQAHLRLTWRWKGLVHWLFANEASPGTSPSCPMLSAVLVSCRGLRIPHLSPPGTHRKCIRWAKEKQAQHSPWVCSSAGWFPRSLWGMIMSWFWNIRDPDQRVRGSKEKWLQAMKSGTHAVLVLSVSLWLEEHTEPREEFLSELALMSGWSSCFLSQFPKICIKINKQTKPKSPRLSLDGQ